MLETSRTVERADEVVQKKEYLKMKAFEVTYCRITGGTIWSGKVIAKDDETVSDALKRKFGLKHLDCERYEGREPNAKEINPTAVPIQYLSVGELMIIVEETIKKQQKN